MGVGLVLWMVSQALAFDGRWVFSHYQCGDEKVDAKRVESQQMRIAGPASLGWFLTTWISIQNEEVFLEDWTIAESQHYLEGSFEPTHQDAHFFVPLSDLRFNEDRITPSIQQWTGFPVRDLSRVQEDLRILGFGEGLNFHLKASDYRYLYLSFAHQGHICQRINSRYGEVPLMAVYQRLIKKQVQQLRTRELLQEMSQKLTHFLKQSCTEEAITNDQSICSVLYEIVVTVTAAHARSVWLTDLQEEFQLVSTLFTAAVRLKYLLDGTPG